MQVHKSEDLLLLVYQPQANGHQPSFRCSEMSAECVSGLQECSQNPVCKVAEPQELLSTEVSGNKVRQLCATWALLTPEPNFVEPCFTSVTIVIM